MDFTIHLEHRFCQNAILNQMAKKEESALNHLDQLANGNCKDGEFTGWFNYPQKRGEALLPEILNFVKNIEVEYEAIIVIGIGGSYLGARAAHHALSGEYGFSGNAELKEIYYAGHHLCPRSYLQLRKIIETKKVLVNFISKTGTTTEPSIAFRIVREMLCESLGSAEANKRIIATTDAKKGALRSLATSENWPSFEVPEDIGGRFSVLTAVGLVPLALAGVDIRTIMQGAKRMFEEILSSGKNSLHPAVKYACLRQAQLDHKNMVEVMAYRQTELQYFCEWWKQLFGESEGKERNGIFPASLQLTTDLHSLGQFLQNGSRGLFETFVTFSARPAELEVTIPSRTENLDRLQYLEGRSMEEINSIAAEATASAHHNGGRDIIELKFDQCIAEEGLGNAFVFFQASCAISALLQGVNPFDQPGVEAYKSKMFELLGRP